MATVLCSCTSRSTTMHAPDASAALSTRKSPSAAAIDWPAGWSTEETSWQTASSAACTVYSATADTATGDSAAVDTASVVHALLRDALSKVTSVLAREIAPLRAVIPASSAVAAQFTGNQALQTTVAVTTTFEDDVPWLVIDPQWWGNANSTERALTLAHEVTHACLRADAGTTPRWLSEGVAQWVSIMALSPSSDVATAPDHSLVRQLVGTATVASAVPADAAFYDPQSQPGAYATALCMVLGAADDIVQRDALRGPRAAAPTLANWHSDTRALMSATDSGVSTSAAATLAAQQDTLARTYTGRTVAQLAARAPYWPGLGPE